MKSPVCWLFGHKWSEWAPIVQPDGINEVFRVCCRCHLEQKTSRLMIEPAPTAFIADIQRMQEKAGYPQNITTGVFAGCSEDELPTMLFVKTPERQIGESVEVEFNFNKYDGWNRLEIPAKTVFFNVRTGQHRKLSLQKVIVMVSSAPYGPDDGKPVELWEPEDMIMMVCPALEEPTQENTPND